MKTSVFILGLMVIFFIGVFNISTACAADAKENSKNPNKELTEAVTEYLETADEQEYEEFMELTINYSWKLLPNKD